jgi:hypothetical protein
MLPWFTLCMVVLAAPGSKVNVAFECSRLNETVFEEQLDLELLRLEVAPTSIKVRCDETSAFLTAQTPARELSAALNLSQISEVAFARTLALAAAELVMAAQNAEIPSVAAVVETPKPNEPAPPAAERPAPRWWMKAGGGLETGAPLLGAAHLSLDTRVFSFLWASAGVSYERGVAVFPVGSVLANALDGLLALLAVLDFKPLSLLAGLGLRGGRIWLLGQPTAGVDGGQLEAWRAAPFVQVGAHVFLQPWLSLGVDVQAGWHLTRTNGFVEGASAVVYENFWLHASASAGVRF